MSAPMLYISRKGAMSVSNGLRYSSVSANEGASEPSAARALVYVIAV